MLFLNMQIDQGVDDELVDDKAQRRTSKRAAIGFRNLLERRVLAGIVSRREGRARGVAGETGEVRGGATAIGAGDNDTGAGVDCPLKDVMTRSHDVVAGILVKDGCEEGFAEDALADAAYGGGTEPLAKGSGVGAVVGAAR